MKEAQEFISEYNKNILFKENLRILFPSIFELIPFESSKWNNLKKRFIKNTYERYLKYMKVGVFPIRPSLYDYATDALDNNDYDKHFIGFINKIFEEIIVGMKVKELKLIIDCVENLLTALDEKFLNYLGELMIINQVQKNGFSIVEREIPVNNNFPKGPRIDFAIYHTQSGEKHNIEVVNIHFTKDDVSEEHLLNRISEKLSEKIMLKDKNGVTNKYLILPNLWCSFDQITVVNSIYQKKLICLPNIWEPSVFVMESNEDVVIYRYGLITTFFCDGKFITTNLNQEWEKTNQS